VKLDSIITGVLTGLVGTAVGFLLLGVFWAMSNGTTLEYFINEIALKSELYKDSMLTISTLFNVGIFYLALRKELWNFCRGILGVILISVPLIIWFQMKAGIS